jgi:hypothetical protein
MTCQRWIKQYQFRHKTTVRAIQQNMFTTRQQISSSSLALLPTTKKKRSTKLTRSFWKKEAPPPPPPPPEKKRFSPFGNKKKTAASPPQQQQQQQQFAYEETKTEAYARIKKQRELRKAEFEARERGGLSQALFKVTRALDFQEDIAADRGLLSAAKRMKKGESMTTEQYGALRRKVGGTKGGFFGESVDVKGEYTDSGWTRTNEDTTTSDVAYAPLLGLVLVGVFATLVLVVQQVP